MVSKKTLETVAGFQRGIEGKGRDKKGNPKAKPSKAKAQFLKRSMRKTLQNAN